MNFWRENQELRFGSRYFLIQHTQNPPGANVHASIRKCTIWLKNVTYPPHYKAIQVEDESGKTVAHLNEKLNIVTNFFESKFQKSDKPFIEAFFDEPRKLKKKPITKEEVRKIINKLNNNRAPGKDGIQGELLKYGPETIDRYIASIINKSFEKHEILDINACEIIVHTVTKARKTKRSAKESATNNTAKHHPKNTFNYRT